jgi:hypothetical protein
MSDITIDPTDINVNALTVTVNGKRVVYVPSEATPDRAPHTSQQLRMLYGLAREIGLTGAERHELSTQILDRDITTWKYLTAHEATRLIDALRGYTLCTHIISERF